MHADRAQDETRQDVKAFVDGQHDNFQGYKQKNAQSESGKVRVAQRAGGELTQTFVLHGPTACNRVLDAASQVGDQVERELFPSFLLSDLFFRFMSDPAAVAEVEAELAAEAGPCPMQVRLFKGGLSNTEWVCGPGFTAAEPRDAGEASMSTLPSRVDLRGTDGLDASEMTVGADDLARSATVAAVDSVARKIAENLLPDAAIPSTGVAMGPGEKDGGVFSRFEGNVPEAVSVTAARVGPAKLGADPLLPHGLGRNRRTWARPAT